MRVSLKHAHLNKGARDDIGKNYRGPGLSSNWYGLFEVIEDKTIMK